ASSIPAACAPTGAGSTTWSPTRCAASPWRRCWRRHRAHRARPSPPPWRGHEDPMNNRTAAIAPAPAEAAAAGNAQIIEQLGRRYDAGFVTDIESDSLPPGLSEDIVRALSAKK